ncbi:MAG: ABC transporter substrate-binding protein [Pseudomonadota bacterium]|nr:ABC transporter substrate-binding protein [Pseudomonadota bacterium]
MSSLPLSTLAQGNAEIVVGQSVPTTGPLATLAGPLIIGTQVYFDQVNASGGVNGSKIKLVTMDDNFQPDRTHENVKKLISADKAIAILNTCGAPNSDGLITKNILSAAGVPLIGPYTASVLVRSRKSPLAYFVASGAGEEADAVVKQIKSMGLTKLGVMYQNDLFGQDGLAEVTRATKAEGIQLVGTGKFERNAEDIEPAIDELGKSAPQAIVMFGPGATTAKFVAGYRKKYGVRSMLISSSAGSVDAIVAATGQQNAAGIGLIQVVPNPANPTVRIAGEYRSALAKFGPKGAQISSYGMQGFITAKVLVEGLKRGGGRDAASLVQGLNSIRAWEMGGITMDFSGGNRQGSRFADIGIIGSSGRLLN